MDDRALHHAYDADKWFERYVAVVKDRDAIDVRLVSMQCRVETLFDAIMQDIPTLWEHRERLKAKIEEHFK